MKTAISKDGTRIAYEELGSGPPLILVDGAFCRRSFGPMAAVAALLKDQFTVIHYDRRGRGESGNGAVYSVAREIEDIQALADTVGGAPFLYGASSGAVLAARAVAGGVRAQKLALYEPPLALDGTHVPEPKDYVARILRLVADGKRREAVKLFMRVVGMPRPMVFVMSLMPMFKGLEEVAHTLPYDFAILGDTQRGGPMPDELRQALGSITVPTLSLAGGKSKDWFKHTARVVAGAIGNGQGRTDIVPGYDHNVAAKAIAPVLADFFAPGPARANLRASAG